MLHQFVYIAAPGSRDVYGKTTFGAAICYSARIEPSQELARSDTTEQANVTADVLINGDVPVTVHHKITLPDGTSPVITAVHKMPDSTGEIHHTKVRCSG